MPRVGMEPLRRRQLIDAAIASIDADGFSGTTVAKICRRAGVSAGLAHHYFTDKDALLFAALVDLLNELRQTAVRRLKDAGSARERAIAVIDANFDKDFCTKPKVTAWLSFWAQVHHSPDLQRLQRINSSRMRSNLFYALRDLLPAPAAAETTEGLCALIDGLWLQWAVNGDRFDSEQARRLCIQYLDLRIETLGIRQT